MKITATVFFIGVGLAALTVVPAALASEVFDSSLASPPGVYFGSGNVNSGFTVLDSTNTDGSVLELGLSAIQRFVGPITPSTNDYDVSTSAGPLASWDFVFSVNTNATGLTNGDVLGDYTYNLSILDENNGHSASFNPTLLPDNAQYGADACPGSGCAYNPLNSGMQNAENLGFSFLSTPLGFDASSTDTYQITLSANPISGTNTDPAVTIQVFPQNVATPEPSTIGLTVALMAGMVFLYRRRRIGAQPRS
ncbi:MAG TPA: PEP-CTERM sorting domain-containing protein [Bryobacteraceae bacterium]|nr:PEP-CTERM sorting domain-containing protein [Bryobacteraceae bacterium]